MKFSYNWLQSFFEKKLPRPEKLAQLLTMHFEEVEGVEKFYNQKEKDFILDIDVRPNRGGDCFSHIGVVREISAITGLKYKNEIKPVKEDKKIKTKDFIAIEVKNKEACQRYTARVICNVKVGQSPKFIQERLKACGLRPINNIVDVTNYIMLETGQPLHAFDFDKLETGNKGKNKKEIIVRNAKKGEEILTLDNENYKLDENILLIADSKEPLAIAGIKGGKKAEIDEKTKTIVLESANFDHQIIRKASKKLNLKTDASWRFEHGIDPNLTELAINKAANLIMEISSKANVNLKITQGLVDFYSKKTFPKKIKLDLNYVERLLGIKIPLNEIKNIFKRLGFKIINEQINQSNYQFMVEVPTFRLDINIPEDLIEEIGRIYGYQNIQPENPKIYLSVPRRNENKFWEGLAKDSLKEAGFYETYNYSFLSKKQTEIFNFKQKELIALKNPLSLNQAYLRPSLIPNLLEDIIKNQNYFQKIKIFELGKVFKKTPQVIEKRMLSGLISSNDFFEMKGVTSFLIERMGISNLWYDTFKQSPNDSKKNIWRIKNSAEIKLGNIEVGFLGEISPQILTELGIKNKIFAFDFDFEKLQKYANEEHEYRPISQFPEAIRDIAVLIPQEVKTDDVLAAIDAAGGDILRDVDLFDFYVGENIPEGKKNLAFHLIFQANDHALTLKEINEIQNKIIKALEKNSGWQVRK